MQAQLIMVIVLGGWFLIANGAAIKYFKEYNKAAEQVENLQKEKVEANEKLQKKDTEISEYLASINKLKLATVEAQKKHKAASVEAASKIQTIVQYENTVKELLARSNVDECKAAKDIVMSYIDYRNGVRDAKPANKNN